MTNLAFDFAGQTVIVTGAAAGIGSSIATLFHRAGATVVAIDRDSAAGSSSGLLEDPRWLFVRADVSNSGELTDAVSHVLDRTGRVDVVVNNAGNTRDRVVWKLDRADWDDVIAVHLTGTYNLTRAAIPPMRERGYGRIINVTSYSGLHGNVGQSNYSAAKAGIIGFTKAVAKEVARFGITVNAISPNARTAMVSAMPEERYAEFERQVPVGRFAEPEEIAPAVGFLASAEAGYVTGAVLSVDGGLSM